MQRELVILPTANDVVHRVASELQQLIHDRIGNGSAFHLSLTGGRIGTQITESLFSAEFLNTVNTALLHIWFSDERFVSADSPDRNDLALPQALRDSRAHIHSMPAASAQPDLNSAVAQAATDLHNGTTTRFCATNTLMDVCLLSMGPDGHIASLFPNHPVLQSTHGVAAVADSPKPPAERITWTFPTINASEQVWLFVSGDEKAEVLRELQTGVELQALPAAGVHGKVHTYIFADQAAASLL